MTTIDKLLEKIGELEARVATMETYLELGGKGA